MGLADRDDQGSALNTQQRMACAKRRRRWCCAWGVLFGLAVLPFAIMLLDRRQPVWFPYGDGVSDPTCTSHCDAEIVPYYVHSGETVTIDWPIIEYRLCQGEYSRRIRESTGKIHFFDRLPTSYSDTLSKDRKWFSRQMTLPRMTPGQALYWTSGLRWCNFMQRIFWPIPFTSPVIKFYVLDDDTQAPNWKDDDVSGAIQR